ncbi:MAG: HAD hydrolase family protein, partial [Holdemanella sp.]|nr:HAD hydrolase family protein [Holdemanella sp.]
YIEMKDKVVYESNMDYKDVQEILSFFEEHGIASSVETNEINYDDMRYTSWVYEKFHGPLNSELERFKYFLEHDYKARDLKELNESIKVKKISFLIDKEEISQMIMERYKDTYNVTAFTNAQGLYNGEIAQKTCTKGTGVKMVSELLHMPITSTIGFGDEMNDVEMIKTCHVGVVMENGCDELKQYATCICESVMDDGIYYECLRRKLIDAYKE